MPNFESWTPYHGAATPPPADEEKQFYSQDQAHRPTLKQYLLTDINNKWTDLILIACCFTSGLIDGLSFNSWGSFSNMHTGNTIFIAIGVSGKPEGSDMLWAKALIAVVVFLVGLVIFISCSRLLGPLRRLTLIFSFTLQTCLLLAAALLVQQEAVSPRSGQQEPIDWLQVLAISMIAFQAAGQLVASRFLAFSEIPTVVLTALVCDLLLDKQLYQRPWSANPKRNRRIGALVAHFFGAMAAGGMAKETGLAGGLWLAMAIKGGITVVWFGWSAKPMQLEKQ